MRTPILNIEDTKTVITFILNREQDNLGYWEGE